MNSKFKEGMKVRIKQNAKKVMSDNNNWHSEMDCTVGAIGVIIVVGDSGGHVKFKDGTSWFYNFEVIEQFTKYSAGQIFHLTSGFDEEFMLCQVAPNRYSMIGIESGNRLNDVQYEPIDHQLGKKEIDEIVGCDYWHLSYHSLKDYIAGNPVKRRVVYVSCEYTTDDEYTSAEEFEKSNPGLTFVRFE